MSIQVTWDDEAQTIIRWDYEVDWSWNDSLNAIEVTGALRSTASSPVVALLMNMIGVDTIPRDSLRNMRRLFQTLHIEDIVIIIGTSSAVNVMTAFIRATFPELAPQVVNAPSVADARALAVRLRGRT